MRFGRLLPLFSLVALLFVPSVASAQQCSADCTHATKACVCAVAPDATGVAVTPVGGIERKPLQLRQALGPGDEIMSVNDNVVVGLTCPGTSDVKLQGRFRVIIVPAAPGEDCSFNLLAGSATIQTNRPTAVTAGETVMGSKRTLYSMSVSRADDTAKIDCAVFEGEADVRQSNSPPKLLTTGNKATWAGGRLTAASSVSREDILQTTTLLARVDAARAKTVDASIDADALQRDLQRREFDPRRGIRRTCHHRDVRPLQVAL
jgi:hypothetical protein